MQTGLLIAGVPALVGAVVLECWRRHVTRTYRRAERRRVARSAAWEAVGELDRAA
jgi:hypothetical protein